MPRKRTTKPPVPRAEIVLPVTRSRRPKVTTASGKRRNLKSGDKVELRSKPQRNTYRSGFEIKVARYLGEKEAPFEYESRQLKFTVPAKKRSYTADFILLPKGIYLESKGKFDRESREKMALVIEQNPDKDIRILFMRNNPISKGSKTRYVDWCEARGIKCAVSESGHVPIEWLEEARGGGPPTDSD
jgi:hypothetical protein